MWHRGQGISPSGQNVRRASQCHCSRPAVVGIKAAGSEKANTRARELCESRGERPGLLSLIVRTVAVDVKQHFGCITKTVGLLGTGAQDGHLDFHTAPKL